MTRHGGALFAALALAAPLTLALPASAQTIPEGQSCGGLVCDLGIIGHKTEPPPPPAAAAPPVAAPQPAADVAPRARNTPRPRKRVAVKPVVTKSAEPPKAVAARRPVPASTPPLSPFSAPAVAVQMPEPKPVRKGPIFYFQSVDPTLAN